MGVLIQMILRLIQGNSIDSLLCLVDLYDEISNVTRCPTYLIASNDSFSFFDKLGLRIDNIYSIVDLNWF